MMYSKTIIGFYFVVILGAIGWLANIVQIFTNLPPSFSEVTPMLVAKVVCIFIAPIGSILGWVGMF